MHHLQTSRRETELVSGLKPWAIAAQVHYDGWHCIESDQFQSVAPRDDLGRGLRWGQGENGIGLIGRESRQPQFFHQDHLLLSNPDLVCSNIAVAWKQPCWCAFSSPSCSLRRGSLRCGKPMPLRRNIHEIFDVIK